MSGLRHFYDGREKPGVFHLTFGAPGPVTLKKTAEIFRQSSEHLSRLAASDDETRGKGYIFQYGPNRGYDPFLRTLATFLGEQYGDPSVDEKDLVLTPGASVGLWLAATVLLQPQLPVVFIECPTYFEMPNILEGRCRLVPVPMSDDGTGVDVKILEDVVGKEYKKHQQQHKQQSGEQHQFWAMFYTIPTFHNPTGSVMSPNKCQKVIEIARKFDLLVFCDDVYNLLHYGGDSNPPKRLLAYDRKEDSDYKGGNVVSNGSFSKILGPGFRVGWMELPPRMSGMIENSGVVQSGGSMNNVTAGVITSALELGLQQRHLLHLRQEYTGRVAAVFAVLAEKLPAGFVARKPEGGYFAWISGPLDFDSGLFADYVLREHGVQVLPSGKCGQSDLMPCNNSFRISIAYYEKESLTKAAEQLCVAVQQFITRRT